MREDVAGPDRILRPCDHADNTNVSSSVCPQSTHPNHPTHLRKLYTSIHCTPIGVPGPVQEAPHVP